MPLTDDNSDVVAGGFLASIRRSPASCFRNVGFSCFRRSEYLARPGIAFKESFDRVLRGCALLVDEPLDGLIQVDSGDIQERVFHDAAKKFFGDGPAIPVVKRDYSIRPGKWRAGLA